MMQLMLWNLAWKSGLPSLAQDCNGMSGECLGHSYPPSFHEKELFSPVDVHETKKNVVITSSIPLDNPKKLAISLFGDRLTIRGERKSEDEFFDKDCYSMNKVYSVFQRTVLLPTEVIAKDIKATYNEGVVKIVIPKCVPSP
jgi:HSP20 family protein